MQIVVIRLIALFGWDGTVQRLSSYVYGELLMVVAEVDEFAARIPLGAGDG